MSALLRFLSLTAEQRRFIWRKQIADSRTPEAWLALFRPLTAFEAAARGGCLWVVLLVLGAGLAISGLSALSGPGWIAGVVSALAGLVLLGAGAGLKVCHLRGQHLGPVLNPLLAVLREDMKPDERVSLQIDLRSPERRANQVGEVAGPALGSAGKIVRTTFAHAWLKGDATLGDGTRLLWTVTDLVRRTRRTRRSSRGKLKVKTKHRVITHLRLQVGLRNDRCVLDPAKGGTLAGENDGRRTWYKCRGLFGGARASEFDAAQFVRMVVGVMARTKPVEDPT